jgi:hypothetical protein
VVSHDELDCDDAIFEGTRNAARVVGQAVRICALKILPLDQSLVVPSEASGGGSDHRVCE